MLLQEMDQAGHIWLMTDCGSGKTDDIAENPAVSLAFVLAVRIGSSPYRASRRCAAMPARSASCGKPAIGMYRRGRTDIESRSRGSHV